MAAASSTAVAGEVPPTPPEYLSHEEAGLHFGYHPSVRDRVRPLLEQADGVREELRSRIGRPVLASVRVRVAVGAVDLERVLPTEGERSLDVVVDSSSGTLAFSIPEDWSDARAQAALRRGFAELALSEVAVEDCPRWFHAGFVHGFAEPAALPRRWRVWTATMTGGLLPLDEIEARAIANARPDEPALAQATDLVRMLAGKPEEFRALLAHATDSTPFDEALSRVYRFDSSGLEVRWREELARVRRMSWLGFGALVAGSALACVALWRRSRRRPSPLDAAEPTRSPDVTDPPPAGERAPRTFLPPKGVSGVPRVSHDGRWHTLH